MSMFNVQCQKVQCQCSMSESSNTTHILRLSCWSTVSGEYSQITNEETPPHHPQYWWKWMKIGEILIYLHKYWVCMHSIGRNRWTLGGLQFWLDSCLHEMTLQCIGENARIEFHLDLWKRIEFHLDEVFTEGSQLVNLLIGHPVGLHWLSFKDNILSYP